MTLHCSSCTNHYRILDHNSTRMLCPAECILDWLLHTKHDTLWQNHFCQNSSLSSLNVLKWLCRAVVVQVIAEYLTTTRGECCAQQNAFLIGFSIPSMTHFDRNTFVRTQIWVHFISQIWQGQEWQLLNGHSPCGTKKFWASWQMHDNDSITEQFAMNVIAWAYKWGHLTIFQSWCCICQIWQGQEWQLLNGHSPCGTKNLWASSQMHDNDSITEQFAMNVIAWVYK